MNLTQVVEVSLKGSGNLKDWLKQTSDNAKDAAKSVNAAKAAAGSMPTLSASTPAWYGSNSNAKNVATALQNSTDVGTSLSDRMRQSWAGYQQAIEDATQMEQDGARQKLQAQLRVISSLQRQRAAEEASEKEVARQKLGAQIAVISSLNRQRVAEENAQQAKIAAEFEAGRSLRLQREAAVKEARDQYEGRWRTSRNVGAAAFATGSATVTGLAGLANPWELERFTKASRDLGAVIGRDLLPYLQAATATVRAAADTWLALPSWFRSVAAGAVALVAVGGGVVLAVTGFRIAIRSVGDAARTAMVQLAAMRASMSFGGVGAGAAGVAGMGAASGLLRVIPYVGIALMALEVMQAFRNRKQSSSYGAAPGHASITDNAGYLAAIQVDALQAQTDSAKKQEELLQQIANNTARDVGNAGGTSADKVMTQLLRDRANGVSFQDKAMDIAETTLAPAYWVYRHFSQ